MIGKVVRVFLILGVVVCLSNAAVHAAQEAQGESASPVVRVPRLIPVNGFLIDHTRRPLAGVVGVTFGLYRDQFGGAPLWLETQNIQLDAAGGYTAFLGAAAAEGLPMELFTSGESRWLGVRAQVFLAEEQPRVLFVSVPYALKAGDADTIGGKPASAFILAPRPSPNDESNPLTETRSIKGGDGPAVFAVVGTGTTNYLPKWLETGGAGTLGDSALRESDGGTHFWFGTGGVSRLSATGGTSAGIWMRFVDQNMYVDSDSNSIFRVNGSGGITEAMRITNAGNVGIGTDAPAGILDARGTNSWFGTSAGGSRLNATGGTNAGIWMRFIDQNMYVDSDLSTIFRVNGNAGLPEAMRITNASNVGIGTVSPAEKLDVSGNMKASGTLTGSRIISTVSNGTSPLTVTSTTVVPNLNASLLGNVAANKLQTRGINYLHGCDTCSALADSDDQGDIYINVVAPMTITKVTCISDAGTPLINLQRDDGTSANILTSNLSCSSTGASSSTFVGSEATLNLDERLDFVLVSANGAKRVTVAIQTVINP